MTLENAYVFLKHFNDLADGTIPQPFGHKDWADVVHNAKLRAADMEKKIAELESPEFRTARGLPKIVKEEEETKPKGKSDGKK